MSVHTSRTSDHQGQPPCEESPLPAECAVGSSVEHHWRDSAGAAQICFAAWVGLVANLALFAVKLAAGLVGHSEAVVADAIHSASDIVTDVAVILGVRYWTAPADDRHPHGHRRIETLVTVAIGLSLAAVALGVGWNAVAGLGEGKSVVPSGVALYAALLSIVVKEMLYRWTLRVARKAGSSALEANAWHHRSDALSSFPAAAAVGVAMIFPNLAFVDLVGAIVVCHFILFAAWRIVRPCVSELADEAAPADQQVRIEALALAVNGVLAAHALRTRYVGSKLAVDLHVEVDGSLSVTQGFELAKAVRLQLLQHGPDVADVMVLVEPFQSGH